MLEHENSEAALEDDPHDGENDQYDGENDQYDGESSSAVSATSASEPNRGTAITDYIGLAKVDRLSPAL